MPHTERVHFPELDREQAQLFVYRFAGDAIQRTGERRLAIWLSAFERMQSIVKNVNHSYSPERRLSILLHAFLQHIPAAQQGAIYLSTAIDHVFIVGAASPSQPDVIGTEINAEGGYIGAVAQVRCSVLIPDTQLEALSGYQEQTPTTLSVRSALVVPFTVGGKAAGVLSLENFERTHAFTQDDLDFASFLSDHMAMAVDNARLLAMYPQGDTWQPLELEAVQSLSNSVPVGVLIVNQNQRRAWGNVAFRRMTGFAQEELGRNLHRIHRSLTQDTSDIAHTIDAQPYDLTLTRQDNTICPVKATLLSFDVLGIRHVKGYVGVFEDLSERISLERQLFHMQRLSNIGTLMSGIAHELNSPLTAVIGFSELLVSREDMPPGSSDDLKTITRQAERSVRIMRELLDYVHLGTKEQTKIDVNYIVRQLVRFRMYAAKTNDLDITLDLVESPLHVLGDAQQLQQVLLNIINNAEQACATAGNPCQVWISTQAVDGQRIRVSVRDNGPGIPAEIQPRVFEPFFTTKPAGEGTGLGLAICQQIIAQHDGHIWIESERQKGTTFFIDLPAAHISEVKHQDTPPASDRHKSELPARVLIADDEKSITNLVAKVLTRSGHHVDIAWDGKEALRKLQANIYDVVLLDLKMPSMSGHNIYAWIKKNHSALLQRTVILTGDTMNPETINFLEQEHITHLLKPFQLVELRNAFNHVWPG